MGFVTTYDQLGKCWSPLTFTLFCHFMVKDDHLLECKHNAKFQILLFENISKQKKFVIFCFRALILLHI